MSSDEEKTTLTVPAASKLLGISRNQGYQAAKDGSLPVLRFGKRIVVPKAALERLLNAGR